MLLIKEQTGATNSSAFQQLPKEVRITTLRELKDRGATLRQLERLTGIGQLLEQRMPSHLYVWLSRDKSQHS